MKTNTTILAILFTVTTLGASSAVAGESSRAVASQPKYSQVVKAETFTKNNPNTVIGGASQRHKTPVANAWWKNRNDSRMNIRKDSKPMEIVRYRIYTHDRQSFTGSRVNDSYRRTVRQVRSGQQVR